MTAMVMKLLVHIEIKAHGQYGEVHFLFHVNNFWGALSLSFWHLAETLGLWPLLPNMDGSTHGARQMLGPPGA